MQLALSAQILPVDEILHGSALDMLRTLPSESIHCCVTSPPYWGLRAYGTEPQVWDGDPSCAHDWSEPVPSAGYRSNDNSPGAMQSIATHSRTERLSEFCLRCKAWRGELGLEPTPDLFVAHLVAIFREVRRVLRRDGSAWVNLGDSFATGGGRVGNCPGGGAQGAGWQGPTTSPNRMRIPGLKPKDLVGIPWRVAFALQADGWWLRSDVIWAKPNPMPESVTDRPVRAHEYIFLVTKSRRYHYDAKAVMEPSRGRASGNVKRKIAKAGERSRNNTHMGSSVPWSPTGEGRQLRTVWTIPPQPFRGAHFATFPPKLIEPCVLASCPSGGVVLDPFFGAGTVGLVAAQHGRHYLGIELQPSYIEIAEKRLAAVQQALPAGRAS